MEQEKNSEMKKKMEEESGYHDGKIYYKKKTKGKWCNSYFWTVSGKEPDSNKDRILVISTLTIKSKLFEHQICW